MTPEWRLYYEDAVIRGHTRAEWDAAPDTGVQALILMEPYDGACPWRGMRPDRQGWTGEEEYSLNGWPPKRGSLLPDADYFAIWARAITED